MIIATAVLGAVTLTAWTADKAAKTPGPTTRPASKVVAIVGTDTITNEQVMVAMQRMRARSPQDALDQLINQKLIEAYVRNVTMLQKRHRSMENQNRSQTKGRQRGNARRVHG